VWDLAVGKFEGGWTVEAALPFKSLRYGPGRDQVWGFQARRSCNNACIVAFRQNDFAIAAPCVIKQPI